MIAGAPGQAWSAARIPSIPWKRPRIPRSGLQRLRQPQLRFLQRLIQQRRGVGFRKPPRGRKLGDQHVPRAIQHLLFAKRQRLLRLKNHQALQHFGHRQQAAVAHAFGVLFEPVFPILVSPASSFGQETEHASNFIFAGDFTKSQFLDMRKRHHYGEAVVCEAEKVETLELTRKGATANVLYGGYPVVRINHLLTNLKRHGGLRSSSWSGYLLALLLHKLHVVLRPKWSNRHLYIDT